MSTENLKDPADQNKDEPKGDEGRGSWGNQIEFILTILGSCSLGLSSVWRFPYLAGRNGGAAFLVPFLLFSLFGGLPIFYLELALGQFSRLTTVILFDRMAPIFAGIGWMMLLIDIYVVTYYNMIVAWSLHYLGNTFRNPLRWSHCNNDFNTFHCYDDVLITECEKNNKTYFFGKCFDEYALAEQAPFINESWTEVIVKNIFEPTSFFENFTMDTMDLPDYNITRKQLIDIFDIGGKVSPPREYLYLSMLGLSKGIEPEHYGTPQIELVMSLFGAWMLVFLSLLAGPKTMGKVVYFTATLPYIILFVLLGRSLTLGKGVKAGLKFFLIPNVTQLTAPKAWADAANQVFFSLGAGSGDLVSVASYSDFHSNFFRDTLIAISGNCLASFFAGLVIFPVVGFIAEELGFTIRDVAADGIALAFQAFPHAINRMAAPQLWSFCFFFMLVLLGLNTQLVIVQAVITAIIDLYPSLRAMPYHLFVVAGVCLSGFLIGLVYTTPGGPYLLTIMNDYGGGWPVFISCLVEIIVVIYVYGLKQFERDVRMMLGLPPSKFYKVLGYPLNIFWKACWCVITPGLLIGVFIFNLAMFQRTTYDANYTFPIWADIMGWFVTLSCVAIVPGVAIYKVIKAKRKGLPLKTLFQTTSQWGPGDARARKKFNQAKRKAQEEAEKAKNAKNGAENGKNGDSNGRVSGNTNPAFEIHPEMTEMTELNKNGTGTRATLGHMSIFPIQEDLSDVLPPSGGIQNGRRWSTSAPSDVIIQPVGVRDEHYWSPKQHRMVRKVSQRRWSLK